MNLRSQQEISTELNIALAEDKQLTAAWYSRMSGQLPWMPGERKMFSDKFNQLTLKIKQLMAEKPRPQRW
jgi:hypothetical protein